MSGLPAPVEKPRFVAEMFGRIAPRYDLMNTLMTLGLDQGWRRAVANSLGQPRAVLDVGTGTAKLAQAVAKRYPAAAVVGVDFSLAMLRAGSRAVPLVAADALRLPFKDQTFDALTSA